MAKLARETGADEKARTFTPWSRVVAMLYAQISHANKVRDCELGRRLFWAQLEHLQSIKDELIVLKGHKARQNHPAPMRRVTARVEIDGRERVMVFLTNNLGWAASSVADLYGCRWEIERFFKELKQTVQLVDFLGHSANAVKWQVWTALLAHLLLRFLALGVAAIVRPGCARNANEPSPSPANNDHICDDLALVRS